MKRYILFILILSSSLSCFSQEKTEKEVYSATADICRAWFWNSHDGAEDFELEIAEIDGDLKGTHCSVAYKGKYIDCSYEDTSIELHRVEANIFEGTILSGYSDTMGKIRITYDKLNNAVHFELLEEPSGVFYLPKDVVMK